MATSIAFDQNINPPPGVPRKTFAEVVYSFTEPESKEGGVTLFPPANAFSRQRQVLNDIIHMSAPVATLEPGNWRLDGSFIMPVLPHVQASLEFGWWSRAMSGGDCVFAEPLVISHEFGEEMDFDTLGIVFDTLAGNWCVDFEASFYDWYGGLLYRERVTGNGAAIANTSRAAMGIKKITIALFSTNKPHHHARVKELNFGAHIVYGQDLIQDVSSLYEADLHGRAIPIPSFGLRIHNGGVYDLLDPESIVRYFKTRQRFSFRIGLRLPDGTREFVQAGNFFLETWDVTDSHVSFKAAGVLSLLDRIQYVRNSFEEAAVGEIARAAYHGVDAVLASPPVTPFFGDVTVREALAMLAELSCCLVHEDGNNAIRFVDVLAGMPPSSRASFSGMFAVPSVKIAEYVNAVELAEYTPNTEWRQVANPELHPGRVEIRFGRPIKGEPEIVLPPGFRLEDVVSFATRLSANLCGDGPCKVLVYGEAVDFVRSDVTYPAPWHNGRQVTVPCKVDLPCMIVTPGFPAFREWFLSRKFALLLMRMEASFAWQQNPAVSVGSVLDVQVHGSGSRANMRVTRQELRFGGSLAGETRAVSTIARRL